MTFNDFIKQAWNDHADKTEEVAAKLMEAGSVIELNDQIPRLAQLITHVFGEHLGQWEKGIQLLQELKSIPEFEAASESGPAIDRSIAALSLASGEKTSVDEFSKSDQVRVLATAAAALNERNDPKNADKWFRVALSKAQDGLDKADPANRALAVTANNLACSLEDKPSRTEIDTEFMILTAQTARKYWEIAGSWLEVERAEYRLSQTYLKAENFAKSLEHAKKSLEIAKANSAPPLEFFFGYEALALAEKALGNVLGFEKAVENVKAYFEKLESDDKPWCEPSLKKLI